MCGIVGIHKKDEYINSDHVHQMNQVLIHRGPDDEGYLAVNTNTRECVPLTGADSKIQGMRVDGFRQNANLYFGHRRLSILDLSSAGHQPMCTSDGVLWIIYNGEIYNYIELRTELKTLGHEFHTNTDTEVVLKACREWGYDCVNKFNGMWSFVIYDKKNNSLFGSRDRFGVKPFYYCRDEHIFAFASEIKALLKIPFFKTGMNYKAIYDYLVYGLIEHEEEGFFNNICELKPSHSFKYDLGNGDYTQWRYYELPYCDMWSSYEADQANEYSNSVKDLIYNAVRLRMRSDVTVGSCLSGGIDSSSIVCVLNDYLKNGENGREGGRQKVFTVCYQSSTFDESDWAQRVVEKTNAAWHRTNPHSDDLITDLEDLVYAQDIPFSSSSIYAQYCVMKLAASENIKVLLDGQGGDELFAGYPGYYRVLWAEAVRNMAFSGLLNEYRGKNNIAIDSKGMVVPILKHFLGSILPVKLKNAMSVRREQKLKYINEDLLNDNKNRNVTFVDKTESNLNSVLHQYMSGVSLKNLLKYEDRNSMRFSVEARTPFADDIPLIEYAFMIPSSYKIRNGWSKSLLRSAMKGVLPDSIRLRRDKIGFLTPEREWLKGKKDIIKQYFSSNLKDVMDLKMLDEWDDFLNRSDQQSVTILWRYVNCAVWAKVFNNHL